jgi:activator of 2-hydroxyglutaryl-CoA dehydratase
MAVRMANLINRVGLERELVITGGQSKNIGIVSRIEENLGVKTLPSPNWRGAGLDPMVAGAIGAALLGRALYLKAQGG